MACLAMPIIIGDYAITVVSCLFLPIIGANVFLESDGCTDGCRHFIDHHFVMQHKGGYTAFVAELTDFLVPGTESVLEIRVSNAQTMDIAPICGDFNMFGGLYRGVELLVTEDVCIEPAYYASSGVFFTQSDVSEKKAHLKIEALLSARETTVTGCEVEFQLYDKEKLLCRVASAEVGEDKRW